MTSRHAVYWSLSAGSWLKAFLYVRCEYVPSTFSSRQASTSRSEALSPATAWAAGSSRSSRNVAVTSRRIGQAQRRFPCRSVLFTLAALLEGRAVEGGRETGGPRLVGVRRHGPRPCLGKPLAQGRIVVQAPDRGGQGARVAGRDDEAGRAVADESARGGSDGIGGDDGAALVHGLVGDEPPRLHEARRGDRRYGHNAGAGIEVAQIPCIERTDDLHAGDAAGRPVALAGDHEHRLAAVQPRGPPRRQQRRDALLGRVAPHEQDLERRAALGGVGGGGPEGVVNRLRGDLDPAGAVVAGERRHVRPVGDDGRGVA